MSAMAPPPQIGAATAARRRSAGAAVPPTHLMLAERLVVCANSQPRGELCESCSGPGWQPSPPCTTQRCLQRVLDESPAVISAPSSLPRPARVAAHCAARASSSQRPPAPSSPPSAICGSPARPAAHPAAAAAASPATTRRCRGGPSTLPPAAPRSSCPACGGRSRAGGALWCSSHTLLI